MRHFFSVKRQVQIDECPVCGRFWLDVGELRRIRSLFKTQQERREAARRYFQEVFGGQLAAMRENREQDVARARRIANVFKFICPSYYIPGKQDWGAF